MSFSWKKENLNISALLRGQWTIFEPVTSQIYVTSQVMTSIISFQNWNVTWRGSIQQNNSSSYLKTYWIVLKSNFVSKTTVGFFHTASGTTLIATCWTRSSLTANAVWFSWSLTSSTRWSLGENREDWWCRKHLLLLTQVMQDATCYHYCWRKGDRKHVNLDTYSTQLLIFRV